MDHFFSQESDAALDLQRMLNPKTAVFIGGSVVEEAIEYTRFNRFNGEIYVVNPFRDAIAGLPCYASVSDLPISPDIAYIGVPKNAVVETIQALAENGCGGAVCNSSGFSEIEGDGVDLQAAFVAAAGHMPVIGPNCPGLANFLDGKVFMQGYFGDFRDVKSGVAVISNGGAYLSDMGTNARSLPLAYSVGLGNQAMLTVADLFDAIIEDERVSAVNLYLESIQDVPRLSRAALKALRRGVPVVVVKGGRSSAGQRATQTHTASLAGDQVVTSALFDRLGFIECGTPEEALETLKMLVFTERPAGNRLAFSTSSGSYAVMGSDAAEAFGLTLPPLGPSLEKRLAELMPAYILPSNPLDISNGQYFDLGQQREMFKAMFAGEFDIAAQVMCFPPEGGWEPETWYRSSEAFAAEAQARQLPCAFVNTLTESLPQQARETMIANRMAPLQGLRNGFLAIGNAVNYSRKVAELGAFNDADIILDAIERSTQPLESFEELTAKALLAGAGLAVPLGRMISRETELSTLDLTFPVVLKALAPNLLHKTEIGGVAVGIDDRHELATAMAEMHSRLSESYPRYASGRFLVEEMVGDVVGELLVGIRYVDGYGLSLTLAVGGVAVELLEDAVTLLLPVSRSRIESALRSLKLFPLLNGYRGRSKGDIEAAIDAIHALAQFAQYQITEIEMVEVNPLLVTRTGAVAVDAVLEMRKDEQGKTV